ncbi:protein of unknown function DUF6 transmembrane [Sulfobacillus acidophilus TPY]|uniref:EamA domain-containing protein n=1 Tax=Sulfobacillus acidophilus (strain ATCC 700253 / DSM 10332 / NAL) TaxID=679936 RepID=G8TT82_SULAD|nr:protein of unknown function DUF6 transmembrane [Sulfobacillus acidophilus TPY]AEW06782.1 protein of unknown function DUF6 transmembrane [Sulfobacillus acidophilus DSM 10332]
MQPSQADRDPPVPRTRPSSIVWLVLMNLIWAIGYPMTTVALHEGMPPSLLAVVRLVGAFLMLWPQLRGLHHLSGKLWGFSAAMGVTGFTLPMWLQIRGIGGTDAAIGAISVALEPLLTVLLAAQITGQRVHRGQQVALGLAILGSWILTGAPRPGHLTHISADLALILAVICYAIYNIYSPRLTQAIAVGPAAALSYGFGAMGAVGLWIVGGAPVPAHVTPALLTSVGFLTVFGTGIAYWLWLLVVSRESMTLSALFLFIQPLLGAFLSVFLGQTRLSLSLVIGGLLVLGAMFIGQDAPLSSRPTSD